MKTRYIFSLLLMVTSSLTQASTCGDFYEKQPRLFSDPSVERGVEFSPYNDNGIFVRCLKNNVSLVFNKMSPTYQQYFSLPDVASVSVDFFGLSGKWSRQQSRFLTGFVNKNKHRKLDHVGLHYTKGNNITSLLPETLYDYSLKNVEFNCSGKTLKVSDEMLRMSAKQVSFVDCQFENARKLLSLYANKINFTSCQFDEILSSRGFLYTQKVLINN
jgi:hypothetical protein